MIKFFIFIQLNIFKKLVYLLKFERFLYNKQK